MKNIHDQLHPYTQNVTYSIKKSRCPRAQARRKQWRKYPANWSRFPKVRLIYKMGISVKTWDTKRSAELFASLLSIFIYLF